MLFDRFVFVLYILLMYTWFLGGVVLTSDYRCIPLILMIASLVSIIIVTRFQLQRLVRRNLMYSGDKWSTVAWASVHISICSLFLMDAFEYVNVLVILGLAGILMTTVMFIVGTCACFVIIRDSQEWQPHLHLLSICFWVLTQYMVLRTSGPNIHVITSIPVICMFLLRVGEHVEHACNIEACMECVLWCACIALHIAHEFGWLPSFIFFIACAVIIIAMSLFSKHSVNVILIAAMPFVLLALMVYTLYKRRTQTWQDTMQHIMSVYDDMMNEPEERLPLDSDDDDFTDSL